jgi:hypothetical protein
MEHHVLRRKSGFSKQLDSGISHTLNMHPYLMASLLITSCLGGYFGDVDTGIVILNCQNYSSVEIGYSATDDVDDNCHVVFEQDYNRSESRKQAATEERKDEDNDSKPELPKKV